MSGENPPGDGRGMIPTLGIDPGTKGGLAVLQSDGEPAHIVPFRPYWTHTQFVFEIGKAFGILHGMGGRVAFVEKVGYIGRRRGKDGKMHKDGGKGAFTFGRVDGLIRGSLLALGAQVRDVPPMCWQMRMKCLTGGDKNVSKRRAQELFPRVKVTHSIADALLIARYGWESLTL